MKVFENRLYSGPYGMYFIVPEGLFQEVKRAGWEQEEALPEGARFLQGREAIISALRLVKAVEPLNQVLTGRELPKEEHDHERDGPSERRGHLTTAGGGNR